MPERQFTYVECVCKTRVLQTASPETGRWSEGGFWAMKALVLRWKLCWLHFWDCNQGHLCHSIFFPNICLYKVKLKLFKFCNIWLSILCRIGHWCFPIALTNLQPKRSVQSWRSTPCRLVCVWFWMSKLLVLLMWASRTLCLIVFRTGDKGGRCHCHRARSHTSEPLLTSLSPTLCLLLQRFSGLGGDWGGVGVGFY